MQRQFAQIGARRVHYRRCGNGPPVVLIHGSPASSEILAAEMQALRPTHTCFAFDTPGFGDSTALDAAVVDIATLADALAETLRTLQFPPCPVFGTHTGAAIAIELALRHPELTTGLILDGVAMYDADEQRDLFKGYFAPLVVEDLGGHYARSWTRFRDLFQWFPWTRKRPENLNEADGPTAERLQLWVSMFFRAAEHYASPYRAAIAYGSHAAEAIASLRVPAVFMAQDSDMLFSHLDRLPPLAANQQIVRTTRNGKPAQIIAAVQRFAARVPPPSDPPLRSRNGVVSRHFVAVPQGQLLLRIAGDAHGDQLPLLLLHDAPGSSLVLEPLLLALCAQRTVLTMDLPGCGDTPALPQSSATLQDFVFCVQQALAALGIERCAIYGCGFGASLALQLALAEPARVRQLMLHGLYVAGDGQRAEMLRHYAPDIAMQDDGSHWYRCWLMLRDSLVYFPWYDRRAQALRRVATDFDPLSLHQRTFETVKQLSGYPQFIRAALSQNTPALCRALASHGVAVTLLRDVLHPFAAFDDSAAALAGELNWAQRCIEDAGVAQLARALA